MSEDRRPRWRRRWAKIRVLLPPSSSGTVLFGVLLALGVFLRTVGLGWGIPPRDNAPSFYHDEGHVLAMVVADWETFRTSFGEYEVVRPVFLWRIIGRPLFALGTRLGWNDPATRVYEFAVLRAVTATFGIAGLFGIYLLGRAIAGTTVGLWALAFLAVMPGHWYYSQILKGDLLVATIFTFLLLGAMRIAARGDRFATLGSGVLLGAGTALKPTVLVAVPMLVLAFAIRALRERTRSALLGRPIAFLLAAAVSFAVLYPYPFLDAARLEELLRNPSSQNFVFRFDVRPQTYVRLWRQYNEPPKVFLAMIFGEPLRRAILPAAGVGLLLGVVALKRTRNWGLLFAAFLAALFFHSLTFTDPLDDRYVLPLAPLLALFVALLAAAGGAIAHVRRPVARGAVLAGLLLFAGTAAATAQTFPAFALRDPREETIRWVTERADPGALVAQPVLLSRWSLVFDRSRVIPVPLIVGADRTRHVARLSRPSFVVVQREPWNYDHTFRRELEGVRQEFADFLRAFDRVATFGREPSLGRVPLPRNIGTPVIDVYRLSRDAPWSRAASLLPAEASARRIPVRRTQHLLLPGTYAEDTLEDAFVRVTVDLRGLSESWRTGGDALWIGLVALFDGEALPETFADLPEDSTFLTTDDSWMWLARVRPQDLAGHSTFSVAFDHALGSSWDIYDGFDGALRVRTGGSTSFRTVRFAVVVLGPEQPAGTVTVTEAAVGRLNTS